MARFRIGEVARGAAANRAANLADLASPLLEGLPPGRLLDYGCGIGWLGCVVAERGGHDLVSLDIKRYPLTSPEAVIELYDGTRIPYPDCHFDAALAAFSLHHTTCAEAALREIKRVTRGPVVVLEDQLASRSMIPFEALKDLVANAFLDRITFQYRTEHAWTALFERLGFQVEKTLRFSSGRLLRFQHVGWCLGQGEEED